MAERQDQLTAAPAAGSAKATTLRRRLRARIVNRSRLYAVLLALILPTFAGMFIFNYYPKWETIKYSFYRWDGSTVEEFRGLRNFREALTADPLFWQTFQLVGIILAANLVKMWPCIFTAVVLHRLRNEKWKYVYRVLFVVPMVIPGLVTLLIWKSFYDPTSGILNTILTRTGLMGLLDWLDRSLPVVAARVSPVRDAIIEPPFGSVWGLGLLGVILLSLPGGLRSLRKMWMWWALLIAASVAIWEPIRAAVTLAVALTAGHVLSRGFTGQNVLKWAGVGAIVLAAVFVAATMIWTEPSAGAGRPGIFQTDTPPWLGHSKLVVPALLFWGCPWVGTIGVLIYLAGLQNISTDVYEAAELDGVGAFGKLFRIELPLIMTQVRINLIFMTIGTINGYGLILILLGPDGGPGNKGMVPGLYMFREAFYNGRFGYACTLGMILFVMILAITILYQKYVKVEK